MGRFDANPAASAWTVVLGAVLGVAIGAALGFGPTGLVLAAVMGVLLAGVVATSLGLVGERDRGTRDDDLPSHYDDY